MKCSFIMKGSRQCGRGIKPGETLCCVHRETRPREMRTHTRGCSNGFWLYFDDSEREPAKMLEFVPGEYFSVPKAVHEPNTAKAIGAMGIAVYVALCSHVRKYRDDGEELAPMAWPSIQTLAEESGCSAMSVNKALKKLEDAALIVIKNQWVNEQGNITTRYRQGLEPTANIYYMLDVREWRV